MGSKSSGTGTCTDAVLKLTRAGRKPVRTGMRCCSKTSQKTHWSSSKTCWTVTEMR